MSIAQKNWKFIYFVLLFCFIGIAKCDSGDNPLIFSTKDCFLTEPVYGHKFDFNALHSDFAHIATSDKGDTFQYNICGNLTRTCDGRQDVAACLKRGSKEYVLGTQHELNYRNGKMYFSFSNGAKCSSGGQYQLHVSIGCDYTLDKNQSKVTGYSDEACSFYITLETPQACLPEPDAVKSNTCSVKDPNTGYTYNLMSLSDANYRTTDRMGSAFVINICKPVLYGENAMCPPGSSICFLALKSTEFKNKYFNYGTVQGNPVIENNKLVMRHPSTTPCNATHNYTSNIYFYCDKDVRNDHPEFIGLHGCSYEFLFVTPLACSNLAPCTVITHGNEILDMRHLQGPSHTLKMLDKSYTFAVCGNAGSPCLEIDGSCVTINGLSTSLGNVDSQLRFNQTGSPYLLYEGGASCQKSGTDATTTKATTFWSTKIEFVCDTNNATMGPKIIENSNCQLLIHYQTKLACQEQITCKAKVYVEHTQDGTGEEVVDLTPLISATENYEARIDSSITEKEVGRSTKFFLNVCRPLVSKYGLGCPGGSAACMAKVGSSTPENEQSLGFPSASLVAINRTTAELRYLQGSICPTDTNLQLSSGIEFYCDMRAGRGVPVLTSITDCHYRFVWPTNVICPPHMCKFNSDTCEIINDEIDEHYNLQTASYTNKGTIKIDVSGTKYNIDICGTHRKAVTDYSQSLVNLFFSAKLPCGVDGTVNVQLRLICSFESKNETLFADDKQCNLVHTQRTPSICKFLGLAIPTATTSNPNQDLTTMAPNSGHPAEQTGSIGVILTAILSVTFFVACLGVLAFSPQRRNSLRRCFRRSTSAVRYSRVQSNEEANLLLEPNGQFTDSDDDDMLL